MPGKFTYKYEADGNTQDVMMEPMFAAIASKRQAADEHGQKPQNTAAGKSRQEHAETQQEAKQEQSPITSYLVGTAVRTSFTLSRKVLHATCRSVGILGLILGRFRKPNQSPKSKLYKQHNIMGTKTVAEQH